MSQVPAPEASVTVAHGFARARRGLLLLAAVGLLVATTACDGGDAGRKAPGKGQAAVLLDGTDNDALQVQLGDGLGGFTAGSDGTVYILSGGIQRIKSDRTVTTLLPDLTHHSRGLVSLRDGSLVFSTDYAVQKLDRHRNVSVLAGVPRRTRSATALVPKSTSASGFRFRSYEVAPIGVRPDGSLIVLDGGVVWSLAKGRLTRLYEVPAADRKTRDLGDHDTAAVDHEGTVYVTVDTSVGSSSYRRVADIMAIHTDGTTAPIALPQSVAGLKGRPADLRVSSLTADGADGIYVNAADDHGMYVLHLHAGRVDLVARALYDAKGNLQDSRGCELKHPVDAKKLPCALPWSITYGDGKLVLGGHEGYLLQIGTK
ncbi:hypothetical protein [Streptomyces sp. NPDC054834]